MLGNYSQRSTDHKQHVNKKHLPSTFNLLAPCILYIGQAFRYSPENAFYTFINKYISLSDICLTVHH